MTEVGLADIPGTKWQTCNGRQLSKLAQAGMLMLERNVQHVNSLNVFPVPDGDTGTNMLLTMRAACNRTQDEPSDHVGTLARTLSKGALMGARGNSGVILSQIWRGLARSLEGKASFSAVDMAAALKEGADTAYKGVMKPVEGTILTVIRAGAEEAGDAARKSGDLRFLLERVLERCEQALERTPEQLPILKQAGVVDSGGQGLVYIFRGMLDYVNGRLSLAEAAATATAAIANAPAQALAVPEDGQLENPYDVQFILLGKNLDVLEVRNRIDAMGDSTVVVGDDTTIKVHIHVKDPGEPISYGASLGIVTDVVVENMQMQMEEIIEGVPAGLAAPADAVTNILPEMKIEPGQIGVVAVAPSEGFAAILTSLGVAEIISGGQTNNPSTEEIFQAIQDVPTDKVIILPNNKNIILAAEAARDLSPKQVAVVPTRTVPQGIGAMMGLNPDGELAEMVAAMTAAAGEIATGEITTAVRSVTIDGVEVAEGNLIALCDGRLCASGPDLDGILATLLAGLDLEERELITLYYGAAVTAAEAETVAAQITAQYPDIEVEVLAGGQAYYDFILGAE
ncbi:MAG: DAK2 domain-containing protein [Anaerolineales bacterium]|nr:DAK2 domain-containing protein [Anaerolineales bacterium]